MFLSACATVEQCSCLRAACPCKAGQEVLYRSRVDGEGGSKHGSSLQQGLSSLDQFQLIDWYSSVHDISECWLRTGRHLAGT